MERQPDHFGRNRENDSEPVLRVNQGKPMNINEIAKLAGVSRATVYGFKMTATSVRIKKRKKKSDRGDGYKPSAQAQTLRT